jgi:hypothetical protein
MHVGFAQRAQICVRIHSLVHAAPRMAAVADAVAMYCEPGMARHWLCCGTVAVRCGLHRVLHVQRAAPLQRGCNASRVVKQKRVLLRQARQQCLTRVALCPAGW